MLGRRQLWVDGKCSGALDHGGVDHDVVWGNHDHMGAAGWVGMASMILFWIAVVVGIVYLIRYLLGRPSSDSQHEPPERREQPGPLAGQEKPDALRTLEDRYARGDIGRDEFIQRRDDLAGKSGQA